MGRYIFLGRIAAIFGILKIGAAYMPIDVAAPADRITYMINNAEAHYCDQR